jgi:hypothetical protein
LGRPFIQTNPYEECVCVKVSVFVEDFGFVFCIFLFGFFFLGGGVGILVIGVINGIYGLFWFIVFLRIL